MSAGFLKSINRLFFVVLISVPFKPAIVMAGPQNPSGSGELATILLIPLAVITYPLNWILDGVDSLGNSLSKQIEKIKLAAPLSGEWKTVFQDINVLNQYSESGKKIELSSALVEGYNLSGAVLSGDTFSKMDWKMTMLKNSTITDTVFRSNSFINIDFTDSKLTNVTFEDSVFTATKFNKSKLKNVKFIRCQFENSNFWDLYDSSVVFDNSKIQYSEPESVSFYGSKMELTFVDSEISGINLSKMKFPSSITLVNSIVGKLWSSDSDFSKVIIDHTKNSDLYGIYFESSKIDELFIRNNVSKLSFFKADFGQVTLTDSVVDAQIQHAKIKSLKIDSCKDENKKYSFLSISSTTINDLDIRSCWINNAYFEYSGFDYLSLMDITFDGDVSFKGTKAEHMTSKNIDLITGEKLNLTRSNVLLGER